MKDTQLSGDVQQENIITATPLLVSDAALGLSLPAAIWLENALHVIVDILHLLEEALPALLVIRPPIPHFLVSHSVRNVLKVLLQP